VGAAIDVARRALAARRFCKVICGVGSHEPERVRRFVALYALAGGSVIDLALDPAVIAAARAGLDLARELAATGGRTLREPLLMVSLGLEEDPHIGAALLDRGICATCPGCTIEDLRLCAERPLELRAPECPPCMRCIGRCPYRAISIAPAWSNQQDLLREAFEAGVTGVELHISGAPVDRVAALVGSLGGLLRPDLLLSFSVGSEVSSPAQVAEQVRFIETVDHPVVVLQTEGQPMSGLPRDGKSELPALQLARHVLALRPRAYVHVAGGTSHLTASLCRILGIAVHGVAFGTAARLAVKEALAAPGLDPVSEVFTASLDAARRLVASVTDDPMPLV